MRRVTIQPGNQGRLKESERQGDVGEEGGRLWRGKMVWGSKLIDSATKSLTDELTKG